MGLNVTQAANTYFQQKLGLAKNAWSDAGETITPAEIQDAVGDVVKAAVGLDKNADVSALTPQVVASAMKNLRAGNSGDQSDNLWWIYNRIGEHREDAPAWQPNAESQALANAMAKFLSQVASDPNSSPEARSFATAVCNADASGQKKGWGPG
jgi:hypothetical protein